jgi:hypothetical protein
VAKGEPLLAPFRFLRVAIQLFFDTGGLPVGMAFDTHTCSLTSAIRLLARAAFVQTSAQKERVTNADRVFETVSNGHGGNSQNNRKLHGQLNT